MSMLAKFVQVAPDLLSRLMDDPEMLESLFALDLEAAPAAPGPMGRSESVQKALRERGLPQMLAASVDRMNPAMREALRARLESMGLNVDAMRGGGGAQDLIKVMVARANRMATSGAGMSGKGASLSMEKAWHGVHYLLCGQAEPGAAILSLAILGGTEVGEDFSGYGPARYFASDSVKEIAAQLSRSNLETEMSARFDPVRMSSLGIYPNGWEPAALNWLMEEFRHLRDFYKEANAKGLAVVTGLV
jgi:hypothetical protein